MKINLRGVFTKLYFNLIFTMQTYKELINSKAIFLNLAPEKVEDTHMGT